MTGTNDESPVEGFGYEKRLEVFEQAGHPDQYLLVMNGSDHMVYNGSRGQLDSYPDIEKHQNMIAHVAKAWWDATLNGDTAAKAWLEGEGIKNWLGADGTMRRR